MHEFSIVRALLDRVEVEAQAHRAHAVQRLALRVGELSGVEVDLLRSAFELLRDASCCRGAELAIEHVPARWCCSRCEAVLPPGAVLRCPRCRAPGRLAQGDEIFLDRVELEVD